MPIQLTASGHTIHAIRALVDLGCVIEAAPERGILRRNGQLVRLRWGLHQSAFRIFIYKITGSGRSQHERRLEITTTYQKGLSHLAGYEDIVLGYEPTRQVFVGVDARRIEHGGETGNASSFIDPLGLAKATDQEITILRRQSQLFGIERHAYFKPPRLAEYLVNAIEIHRGVYNGAGSFSDNRVVVPRPTLTSATAPHGTIDVVMRGPNDLRKLLTISVRALEAYEEGDSNALQGLQVTQAELTQLAIRLQEIGLKGEELVFKAEIARLRRQGRQDLASKVTWVSQSRPYEGYDILSYDVAGSKRYIEVKSTPGHKKQFPMSENEWQVAASRGDKYSIYRVTNVFHKPSRRVLKDPVALELAGTIRRTPLASIVAYS